MDANKELLCAVKTYFDALYYCDVSMLNEIFHEDSSLFDVDEGNIFVESIAKILAKMSKEEHRLPAKNNNVKMKFQ